MAIRNDNASQAPQTHDPHSWLERTVRAPIFPPSAPPTLPHPRRLGCVFRIPGTFVFYNVFTMHRRTCWRYWHPFAAVSPPRRFGLLGAYRSNRFYVGQPGEGAAGKGDPHPPGQGRGNPQGKRLCHRCLDVFILFLVCIHFPNISFLLSGQSHALYMYTVECL